MTRKEYQQYEAAVSAFMQAEGINCLSRSDSDREGDFSWRACECCGSSLGGTRIDASGYNPQTREIQEYRICTDCEYYAEYGQLDDQTMLDMDDKG